MENIERLGFFYLGKPYDLKTGQTEERPVMYDARDLTTHAICVGMTGSGKTGLCIGLLEEAALHDIPTIAIDPKGDLTNLVLSWPDLDAPADFPEWLDLAVVEAADGDADSRGRGPRRPVAERPGGLGPGARRHPPTAASARTSLIYTPGSSMPACRSASRPLRSPAAD